MQYSDDLKCSKNAVCDYGSRTFRALKDFFKSKDGSDYSKYYYYRWSHLKRLYHRKMNIFFSTEPIPF